MPHHGNARIDLMANDEDGIPTILDFKTKVTIKDYFRDQFVDDFEYSWQMYHYAWAMSEVLDKDIEQFALALVIIEPKVKVIVEKFPVDQFYLWQRWLPSAKVYWEQMEAYEQADELGEGYIVPQSPNHRDPWGLCEYHHHCLENSDSDLIQIGESI